MTLGATPVERIGVVGIGRMGWPIAAGLLSKRFDVTVFDVVPGRAAEFVNREGGRFATDGADLVRSVEAVLTILPTSAEVLSFVNSARAALRPGTLFLEMSSGDPKVTQRLANELVELGVAMVDCPVSGGVRRAHTGELSVMVGGQAEHVLRAEPILMAVGGSVHYCGQAGSGQAMKALNNLVSAGGFLLAAEALVVGKKFGLDPSVMTDVLNESSGMNHATRTKIKDFVLSGSYDSGFSLGLMVKDLTTAIDIGLDTRTPAPFSALCQQLWSAASSLLEQEQDHTAMARFVESVGGVSLVSGGRQGHQGAASE